MRGSHRLSFGIASKNVRRDIIIYTFASYAALLLILLLLACASIPVASAYSLTSSGIWPSLSGGEPYYYQGINTLEVRWGEPAMGIKSGLRFDGQASSYSFNQDFCLGKLTHYNYPVYSGTAASGARLKVTLRFNDIAVPETSFYFDLNILETTNGYPCPEFQKSSTPCDDLVWWSNVESSQSFTLQNGEAYSLMIVGFTDSFPSGNPVNRFVTEEQKANTAYLVGRIIRCVPTTISVQPADTSVCQDQDATFTVTGNGTGLTYQWYKDSTPLTDGGDISGATTSTLKIATATTSDGGRYKVIINGACGSATSNAAVLTVNSLPTITRQPRDQTVCEGSSASFSVTASAATSYQWQVSTDGGSSWDNINAATDSTYIINPVLGSIHNDNEYRVVVSNSLCSITSDDARLTVNFPWITSDPTNRTVCSGGTAAFSASVTTSWWGSTSYQWQVSKDGGSTWNNILWASSTSYSFTAKPEDDGNMYRLMAKKSGCTVYSAAATLAVNTMPQFTTQPSPQVVCEGQIASFTVAVGGGITSGQWQYRTSSTGSWTDISGQTETTLYLYNVTLAMNGYEYRYLAANSCGSASSNPASLKVNSVTLQIDGKKDSCIITPTIYSPSISGTCNSQYRFTWMIDGTQVTSVLNNGSIRVDWDDYGDGYHLLKLIVDSIDDQGNTHYLGQKEMNVTVIDLPSAAIKFV